ncbi:hypothetical protein CKA32_000604 [Geitlerinema sp. FC II]|nr:hypothetical protein CKA32_000604 [Geitlerinema sp. FC II]
MVGKQRADAVYVTEGFWRSHLWDSVIPRLGRECQQTIELLRNVTIADRTVGGIKSLDRRDFQGLRLPNVTFVFERTVELHHE